MEVLGKKGVKMCINKSGADSSLNPKILLRGVAPNLAVRNRRADAEGSEEQLSHLE